MKDRKGFTVVELMVVMVLIGVMLAMGVPALMKALRDYRFYAATQAFENSASALRVRALGGPVSYWVKKIELGPTNKEFKVYLSDFKFTLPREGALGSPREYPIKSDDFVSLAGFNEPKNVNDRVFQITLIDWASATLSGTADSAFETWSVSNLTLVCKSCDPADSSKCIVWDSTANPYPSGTGWSAGSEPGRIRVLPCLKFSDKLADGSTEPFRGNYSATKDLTGNSITCRYNPRLHDIKVRQTRSGLASAVLVTPSVLVFDFAGSTRDQLTYIVEIRRLKSDGTFYVDTEVPPAVFSVTPAGRIRYGYEAN